MNLFALYRMAVSLLSPLIRLYVYYRLFLGKEDRQRLKERFGISALPRPKGQLLWIHAASVGESLSILPLIKAIHEQFPAYKILVTTGTITSAALMQERLPPYAFHQYVPVDTAFSVTRFLKHWQPDLALWVESELWPLLVMETSKQCKIILLNARMSERSLQFWQRYPSLIRLLLGTFAICLPQSDQDKTRLKALGAEKMPYTGNLKYAAEKLPVDSEVLLELKAQTAGRLLWVAASTHKGEEEQLLAIHNYLKATFPSLLTIIIPRHPVRGEEVAALVTKAQLQGARRSLAAAITAETDIYIADTIGELGIFYTLSPLVFVGGSLIPHGGQNPLEPARFGCTIMVGPYTHNFAAIIERMKMKEALDIVPDKERLQEKLAQFLKDDSLAKERGEAAKAVAEEEAAILPTIIEHLKHYL